MPTAFTKHAGIELPIICDAIYPCSNPELARTGTKTGPLAKRLLNRRAGSSGGLHGRPT